MSPGRGLVLSIALGASHLLLAATAPDWVVRASSTRVDSVLLQTTPRPDAVVLWKQQIVTAAESGATKLYQREAVRVLTPKGTSAATFVSSHNSDSRVDVEGGWTVHADGKVERLDLKEVVSLQLAHPEFFTDDYVIAFQPPRLSPGDVAASAFNWSSHNVYQWLLPVQAAQPIAAQEVVVDLPQGWTHRWRLTVAPDGYSGSLSGGGSSKASYRLGPQRGIISEESSPPPNDLFAMFQLTVLPPPGVFSEFVFDSWNDVAAWFYQKSLPARSDPPDDLTTALQGDVRREAAQLVQERIRYVAVLVGEGNYVPRDPSLVAKRLYGDCKDKSFLLMALLAKRGIVALPVLTRPRNDGHIDPTFPATIQFNHLIVAVPVPGPTGLPAEVKLRDGIAILFDPTDSGTPYGQLPEGLQGSRGLVVRYGESELVEFPFAPTAMNRFARTLEGEVIDDGRLAADVIETGDGALSDREILQTLSPRELEKMFAQFVEQSLPGSRASNVHLPKPQSPVSPVEVRFSLSSEQYLRRAGDFFLLPVVPLSIGPRRLPRLSERRFPIVLGVPAVRQLTASFRLPDGFRVDALPDPIEVENRYARYRFSASLKEGRIVTSETYETREPEIPPREIAAWKALENAAGKGAAAKAVIVRTH